MIVVYSDGGLLSRLLRTLLCGGVANLLFCWGAGKFRDVKHGIEGACGPLFIHTDKSKMKVKEAEERERQRQGQAPSELEIKK